MNATAISGRETKWSKIDHKIFKWGQAARNGEISYVDAYKKTKQILQDAGLEEGLSDEQIARAARAEKSAQKSKELEAAKTEIKKIVGAHNHETNPLSQNLKAQANTIWHNLNEGKISPLWAK